MTPIVSVILPAYNAEATIAETIQSIIDQTYTNWELVVINDGSTDNTEKIVKSFYDVRIKYFENEGNKKLIYTLNRGLNLASGKYIARMDADDICKPQRFEKQVSFMETHREVIVCGTQIDYFGSKANIYRKLKFPTNDKDLKEMLATSTCFAHPSVMIRRDVLIKSGVLYDMRYKNAEDYCLWIDLASYGKYANLEESLLLYRISDTQISQPNNLQTMKSVIACKKKYVRTYLNESLVESIFEEPIDISVLKRVKKETRNKKILEGCYLSLANYGISVFLYYIVSLDAFKLGLRGALRFFKRYIYGKAPIYFNIK